MRRSRATTTTPAGASTATQQRAQPHRDVVGLGAPHHGVPCLCAPGSWAGFIFMAFIDRKDEENKIKKKKKAPPRLACTLHSPGPALVAPKDASSSSLSPSPIHVGVLAWVLGDQEK